MRILLSICMFYALSISAQTKNERMFMFAHSLVNHEYFGDGIIVTPNETAVPHWMKLLADERNYNYAAGGQYGFLPQHRNTPPFSQWGFAQVPGVWDSDTESFSDADITSILLTAANFIQWQAPNLEYPSDPGITPISATSDVFQWVSSQETGVKYYIYENWPDMGGYTNGNWPPSTTDLDAYHAYTLGGFHDWWLDYYDGVRQSLTSLNIPIRMIPVGPILSELITGDLIPNIPFTDLYEDDAPHGRENLYLLAGMITYMAVYEEEAPILSSFPSSIHSDIITNYSAIVDFIWSRLNTYTDSSGENLAFVNAPITSGEDAMVKLMEGGALFIDNPQGFIIRGMDNQCYRIFINADGNLDRSALDNCPE